MKGLTWTATAKNQARMIPVPEARHEKKNNAEHT